MTAASLDPNFAPMEQFLRQVSASGSTDRSLRFALERENGLVSRFDFSLGDIDAARELVCADRLLKFLLWSRGGWKVTVEGSSAAVGHLQKAYSSGGGRAFDVGVMEQIYQQSFTVESAAADGLPEAKELAQPLGGHLDGCRIGFDLGASDYKIAAVREGEVVFSTEVPWNPKVEPDPSYHYQHLSEGLRLAASHLPRVDAIGGSSAGVIVNNRFMVASLLRSIAPEKLEEARNLFHRLAGEWKVPFEVANDGDVTALAGAMSLETGGLLGIAMGSSEAAGYINPSGNMTGWLNELAFAPVDLNPEAPADEWSGDHGVGALYFSQQAVNKLLPAAGIAVPDEMDLPARLKQVQQLMGEGKPEAAAIYKAVGTYLGHSVPLYARFYDFEHVLVLGRVTTGEGGAILLDTAKEVLEQQYPDLAGRMQLHLPDEKSRRVGQAVAAASLPQIG